VFAPVSAPRVRITRLSGRVDPVSQSIRVFGEITDPSADLIAGMSGRATIAPPQ
jgi:membrane fusion protein (multidrug efflux system)